MSNTLIYALNPNNDVISVKSDIQGRLLLSGDSSINVSISENLNLETTQQEVKAELLLIKNELISIDNNTTQEQRQTDNGYFTGTFTANQTTDTIDLGTKSTIQFGGKSDTSNFSFVIEYSNDGVIFSTDGYEPELTLVGTEYRFNLTRTNICMRYVRLLCINTGNNVVIAYSTIQ